MLNGPGFRYRQNPEEGINSYYTDISWPLTLDMKLLTVHCSSKNVGDNQYKEL